MQGLPKHKTAAGFAGVAASSPRGKAHELLSLQTRDCHYKDVDTLLALLFTADACLETRSPVSQGKLSLASTA